MRRVLITMFLAVLFCAALNAGEQKKRLVLLPFENLSGAEIASLDVTRYVLTSLAAKGWEIVDRETVEELLEKERVRYLDSLDDGIRVRILDAGGAGGVVSGTVYTYAEGRHPAVAFSLRLTTAAGGMAWSDVVAVSVSDTERAFGFGRASTVGGLVPFAVSRLMENFPRAGEGRLPVRGEGKPLFKSGPSFYYSDPSGDSSPHLVCILPFENQSGSPEASRVAGDLIALRLGAATGFRVVDAASLRTAALESRIASFRTISDAELEALAKSVGTPLFLRGKVYEFHDGSGRGAVPQISLELTLTDIRAHKDVWVVQHEKSGLDYVGFLMRGAETTGVGLADRVVSEMVQTAERGERGGDLSVASRSVRRPLALKNSRLQTNDKRRTNE